MPNKKRYRKTESARISKLEASQNEFDQPLQSIDDFLLLRDAPDNIASTANESSVDVFSLETSPHAIRRAIQELESGSLDELLVQKLTYLDRNSAEFRQEYVMLRVESLTIRPRTSSGPLSKVEAIAGNTGTQDMPNRGNHKNPWAVYTISDLWRFFGPLMSALIILQLFNSYQLGALFKSYEILHGNFTLNLATLIIALVSLLISSLVLYGCRGRLYTMFIPRFIGIATVNAVIAIAPFLLKMIL